MGGDLSGRNGHGTEKYFPLEREAVKKSRKEQYENESTETIPFNEWSRRRIKEGRKYCTSRKRIWNDPRVFRIEKMLWKFIKKNHWREEGANSPEELQAVVNRIFRREIKDDESFYVHWGEFKREKIRSVNI